MPRIGDYFLDCTFYLYKSKEDATKNQNIGGTGFFASLLSTLIPTKIRYVYAVTNWHVAVKGGCSVIRVNTKDGKTSVLEYAPEDWEFDENGDDLAILPIQIDFGLYKISTVPLNSYIPTKEQALEMDVGIGDDVFMIGRFIDHDGGTTNLPAARFGNISVMPAPIRQPNGNIRDSYCLDLHSRSGYSGSPVFVYRTPGNNLAETMETGAVLKPRFFLFLLGIHWGQFPEEWEIKDKTTLSEAASLKIEGKVISGLSGMTCVLPSTRLIDLLNKENLKSRRDAGDAYWQTKFANDNSTPVAESVSSNDNPNHQEDFNNLLDAAVTVKPSID